MPIDWKEWLKSLADEAGVLAKDELIGFVTEAVSDANDFLQRQAKKVERYLIEMANGEITKEDFENNVKDIARLTRMEQRRLQVAAKARAQRLIDGIENLLLDKLLKLL